MIVFGVIRESFSYPEFIADSSDRHPSVTLLLLAWLRSVHQEPAVLGDITETEEYVRRQER